MNMSLHIHTREIETRGESQRRQDGDVASIFGVGACEGLIAGRVVDDFVAE